MSKYIIIDSYKSYADKLLTQLDGSGSVNLIIDSSQHESVSDIFEIFAVMIKKDSTITILVNADTKMKSSDQNILDIILWVRCKLESFNPIVVYSTSTLQVILRKQPENYFLISEGCVFKPATSISSEIAEIKALNPVTELESLKPFIKPKVDEILSANKHRIANYAAMAMMLNIAKQVYDKPHDNQIMKGSFHRFYSYRKSLDYYLLSSYYGLEKPILNNEDKVMLKGENSKRILIVDDLASDGWQILISQMLYGKPDASEVANVKIYTTSKDEFDEAKSKLELEKQIKKHKPHLILLDLRLCDESGRVYPEKLGGYKLLKFLKASTDYKGVPVIMFTASTNAQTVKILIDSGAYCVWTKPGIDEELSVDGITKRYGQLLFFVNKVFSDFDTRNLASLNNNEKTNKTSSFEEMRGKLLNLTHYLKYRGELHKMKSQGHYFNSFTDIFIDTNSLMSGVNFNNDKSVDFATTILNIYKLAQICGTQQHTISVNGKVIEMDIPKLVVLNFVLDEVIEKTKIVDNFQPKSWKRALLGYSIIRALFDNDKNVRTEFCFVDNAGIPKTRLQVPASRHYADPVIIEEIVRIISGDDFVLKQGSAPVNISYKTQKPKVLLICDENPNGKGASKKLPSLLNNRINALDAPKGSVEIFRLLEFNKKMNEIEL